MGAGEVCGVVYAEVGGAGDGDFGEDETTLLDLVVDLDVHDDELDEFGDVGERGERRAPVDWGADFGGLESVWVEQVDGCSDAVAEGERGDVADALG